MIYCVVSNAQVCVMVPLPHALLQQIRVPSVLQPHKELDIYDAAHLQLLDRGSCLDQVAFRRVYDVSTTSAFRRV